MLAHALDAYEGVYGELPFIRVLGIDPGRHNIVYAVERGPDGQWYTLALTRTRYYLCIGSKFAKERADRRERWLCRNYTFDSRAYDYANKQLAQHDAKTADLEKLVKHARIVRDNASALWWHALQRWQARERLRAAIAKQRVLDRFIERLRYPLWLDPDMLSPEEKARWRKQSANVFIAYGAANFPASGRGERAVPTASLFRRIKAAFPGTERVDEYATSKMCPDCGGKLSEVHGWQEGYVKRNGDAVAAGVREMRGLRKCENTCDKFVNRDMAAAVNILLAGVLARLGAPRPAYLTRKNPANTGPMPEYHLNVLDELYWPPRRVFRMA